MDIDKFKNVPNSSSYLKNKVDKLHVDKLVPVPVDLSKQSDVVKNDVVEKDVYNAKIKNIEHKIPDITNVATNTTLNAKLNDIKNKIPDITNLAATAAFTTVGKKVPCVSGLIKKADYDAKIPQMGRNILLLVIIISARVIHLMQR